MVGAGGVVVVGAAAAAPPPPGPWDPLCTTTDFDCAVVSRSSSVSLRAAGPELASLPSRTFLNQTTTSNEANAN